MLIFLAAWKNKSYHFLKSFKPKKKIFSGIYWAQFSRPCSHLGLHIKLPILRPSLFNLSQYIRQRKWLVFCIECRHVYKTCLFSFLAIKIFNCCNNIVNSHSLKTSYSSLSWNFLPFHIQKKDAREGLWGCIPYWIIFHRDSLK